VASSWASAPAHERLRASKHCFFESNWRNELAVAGIVEERTFRGQSGAGIGKRPNRRSPDNGIRFETSETPKTLTGRLIRRVATHIISLTRPNSASI